MKVYSNNRRHLHRIRLVLAFSKSKYYGKLLALYLLDFYFLFDKYYMVTIVWLNKYTWQFNSWFIIWLNIFNMYESHL